MCDAASRLLQENNIPGARLAEAGRLDILASQYQSILSQRAELSQSRISMQKRQTHITKDARVINAERRNLKRRLQMLENDIGKKTDDLADLEWDIQENIFEDRLQFNKGREIQGQMTRIMRQGIKEEHQTI
ncbi:MAG: hypothetical protein Q9216_001742 [Gyalolechia sp. 2 TL-2023]